MSDDSPDEFAAFRAKLKNEAERKKIARRKYLTQKAAEYRRIAREKRERLRLATLIKNNIIDEDDEPIEIGRQNSDEVACACSSTESHSASNTDRTKIFNVRATESLSSYNKDDTEDCSSAPDENADLGIAEGYNNKDDAEECSSSSGENADLGIAEGYNNKDDAEECSSSSGVCVQVQEVWITSC